jgi:hypothetical protein
MGRLAHFFVASSRRCVTVCMYASFVDAGNTLPNECFKRCAYRNDKQSRVGAAVDTSSKCEMKC